MSSHRPADRFAIRTPALPLEALARLCADSVALRAALGDPAITEALYLASPEFAERALAWCAGERTDPAVERSLVRYLSRMASRATPFGLFACVGVGEPGAATRLELGERAARRRHTRLDNEYLFAVAAALAGDRTRGELRFVPSSSLYRLAGRWRHVEVARGDHGRVFQLVAVEDSAPLADALRLAAPGATVGELAAALARDHAIELGDAEDFVHELIDAQLLVLELGPPITGDEPGPAMVRALAAGRAGAGLAAALGTAIDGLAAIDALPPGAPIARYEAVAAGLAALPVGFERGRLFQSDGFLAAADVALGPSAVAAIRDGIAVLRRLAPEPDPDDDWARFRAAFRDRYKEREVPLVDVLDDETGIGFGGSSDGGQASLLANLAFVDRRAPPPPRPVPRGAARLLALYARAITDGATVIELGDADLDELAAATPAALPDSFAVMATFLAASAEAIDAGRFRLRLAQLQGPTATRLLGRFCHGDPAIAALVRGLAADEARLRAPALLAEIVHLPADRVANILLRPVVRDHEIAFLGTSGADRDRRIPVTDLQVSVIDDRVVLRSARLDREIVPLLSAAHNYSARGLGLYRFLCALAAQDLRVGHWSWGDLTDAPFLPRVMHGRLELAPARWLLEAGELAPVQRAVHAASRATSDAALAAARVAVVAEMAALRAVRRLPRWVMCGHGDTALTVDLTSAPCIESAIQLGKDQPQMRWYEVTDTQDQLCARGGGAGYVHEIVMPWVRSAAPPRPTRFRAPITVERRFPPGSPWLYLKLYGGAAGLDRVLRDAIRPLVSAWRDQHRIRRWFFVRYRDPDLHLRIRFALDAAELPAVQRELAERTAQLVAAGLVWRVQYDTYEREIDRYGGDRGIALSEAVFDADSDAALAIVDAAPGHDDARWLLALAGMHHLLVDLGLGLAERSRLITARRDSLGTEYGMTTAFQRELGSKFRAHEAAIRGALDAGTARPTALDMLHRRSEQLATTAAALREAAAAGRLTVPIDGLADSYIHMHANRVLLIDSRPQELVLYDFLRRYYLGQLHRR